MKKYVLPAGQCAAGLDLTDATTPELSRVLTLP